MCVMKSQLEPFNEGSDSSSTTDHRFMYSSKRECGSLPLVCCPCAYAHNQADPHKARSEQRAIFPTRPLLILVERLRPVWMIFWSFPTIVKTDDLQVVLIDDRNRHAAWMLSASYAEPHCTKTRAYRVGSFDSFLAPQPYSERDRLAERSMGHGWTFEITLSWEHTGSVITPLLP